MDCVSDLLRSVGLSKELFHLATQALHEGKFDDSRKIFLSLVKDADNEFALHSAHFLAWMYEQGLGVNIDKERAFDLWLKNACSGFVESQEAVADCFLSGRGVQKDEVQALAWLKVTQHSSLQSSRSADLGRKILTLESKLTEKQKRASNEVFESLEIKKPNYRGH